MKCKTLVFTLFFCCLAIFSSAHANPIRVGTVFFNPPFVISPGNGFDIDLIRTVLKRMNAPFDFIPMDYHQLFTALNEGKIDIAIGGISISKERLTKYLFSLPYMLSKGQFLVLKTSDVKSLADLKGDKVGVMRGEEQGSVFYNFLLDNNANNQFQIIFYDDMEDMITALGHGDILAAFTHKSTVNYWIQNGGGQFKTFGNDIILGQGLAIMALPSNSGLIQKINQQLVGMEKDNSYLNLYKMYFAND